MDRNPASIVSDEPEEKILWFSFDGHAQTIADLVTYRENRTPLVIGVFGP